MENYFLLEIVSPVHIGCDEVYEPTSFCVDRERSELVTFDPEHFLSMLNEDQRKEYSRICKEGSALSIIKLYRFIDRYQSNVHGLHRVKLPSKFVDHFEKTLRISTEEDAKKNLNLYKIDRTAFLPLSFLPYIPGSAIKGAIRTAVLNFRNRGRSTPNVAPKKAGELETTLLGGRFDKDPFSLIKVSDFIPVKGISRKISYAVNRKKRLSNRPARGENLTQIMEVLEKGAIFIGKITVEKARNENVNKEVGIDEIKRALHYFYGAENQRENRELTNIGAQRLKISTGENSFPLRLGRHSGAECVTINGHRNIKIMLGRHRKTHKEYATTLWLSGDSKSPGSNTLLRPFGWARLEEVSQDKAREYFRESERLQRQFENVRIQKAYELKERFAAIKKQEEKRRRQEEERKRYPWRHLLSEVERTSDLIALKRHITAHESFQTWFENIPEFRDGVRARLMHILEEKASETKDWGTFVQQILENELINFFQKDKGIAELVRKVALRLKKLGTRKWKGERDEKIAAWLETAGLSWESGPSSRSDEAEASLTQEELNILEKIKSYKDWGDFKKDPVDMDNLTLPCLKALEKRGREWKCHERRAKKDKKAFWKQLKSKLG